MHKVQTNRKLQSELIIEQFKDDGKKYLEHLIFELELEQMAESIVQIVKRFPHKSKRETAKSLNSIRQQSENNIPSKLKLRLQKNDLKWHYKL